LTQGVDCSFLVGEHLLISGGPCWLHFFRGEMFVFELSPRQARRTGVEPNVLRFMAARIPHPVRAGARYPIELGPLRLVGGGRIPAAAPLAGSCSYSISWDRMWDYGPGFAVQLDYQAPDAKTIASWSYPAGPMQAAGDLAFTFPPLQVSDLPRFGAYRGCLTLFVCVCTVPDPHRSEGRAAVSNTRAALVDVE
jgi:hypothetical protein